MDFDMSMKQNCGPSGQTQQVQDVLMREQTSAEADVRYLHTR